MNLHARDHVLRIDGCRELCANSSPALLDAVRSALKQVSVVEIDLSGILVMDCRGLGTLVSIRNLLRERAGRLCLLNPSEPVQRMFHATCAAYLSELVRSDLVVPPDLASQAAGHPPIEAQLALV